MARYSGLIRTGEELFFPGATRRAKIILNILPPNHYLRHQQQQQQQQQHEPAATRPLSAFKSRVCRLAIVASSNAGLHGNQIGARFEEAATQFSDT